MIDTLVIIFVSFITGWLCQGWSRVAVDKASGISDAFLRLVHNQPPPLFEHEHRSVHQLGLGTVKIKAIKSDTGLHWMIIGLSIHDDQVLHG